MAEFVDPAEPGTVSCEVCLKEMQHAHAMMEEVNDYVMYFCGLECYSRWREGNPPGEGE